MLPLILSAIPAAMSLFSGIKQSIEASNIEPNRPTRQIPKSIEDSVRNASMMASMRELPGQSIMEGKIGASTSAGVSQLKESATDPNSLMSSIARLYAGEQANMRDIGLNAARNYYTNQAGLRSELRNKGTWEDEIWKSNMYEPYMMDMKEKAAKEEAGAQNIYGAATSAANLGTQYKQLDMMQELYGLGKYKDKNKVPPVTDATANTTIPTTPYSANMPNGLNVNAPFMNQEIPNQQDSNLKFLYNLMGGWKNPTSLIPFKF